MLGKEKGKDDHQRGEIVRGWPQCDSHQMDPISHSKPIRIEESRILFTTAQYLDVYTSASAINASKPTGTDNDKRVNSRRTTQKQSACRNTVGWITYFLLFFSFFLSVQSPFAQSLGSFKEGLDIYVFEFDLETVCFDGYPGCVMKNHAVDKIEFSCCASGLIDEFWPLTLFRTMTTTMM